MSEPKSTRKAIEAIWRIEAARLIGGLTRLTRDVGRAEDLAQEALLSALERWPEQGIPDNPGAWLMTTAKNRGLDELRRARMADGKQAAMIHELTPLEGPSPDARLEEPIGDDRLRLLFIACHPILSREARVALTLRLLGGLSTEEIARAFLLEETTLAQRIVRAKRTLGEARVPFELPPAAELHHRLTAVLDVVYLVFNEGYAATRGDDWLRLDLCEDALRLGRMLAALLPDQAEVHGLLALMELSAARFRARLGPDGAPVLLLDQDRSLWDQLLLGRGLEGLARAERLAAPLGPFTLQAAIAACHARARRAEDTDWQRIVALYDALVELTESPIVELNRAVAVSMAFGPEPALEMVDALVREKLLEGYHLLPSVRGDLLAKLGRTEEARREFERAAFLAKNSRERELLLSRARA